MQLISKFDKEFVFYYVLLKENFQKILKESNQKPNKILVDISSDLYDRSLKPWLEKNDI